MNYVDFIIVIPLIYAAWKGFRKGLVIEVFTLLALFVGLYAGINFSDWTSEKILSGLSLETEYLPVIAFTITFLGVGAMVFFAGKAIEGLLKVTNLSIFNKIAGLAFGLLKMLMVLSVLIVLIESYDEKGQFFKTELKENSLLYYPLKTISLTTIPGLKNSKIWLENNIQEGLISGELPS